MTSFHYFLIFNSIAENQQSYLISDSYVNRNSLTGYLLRFVRRPVYEEILEHQITGQTVLMISDDYLFIWSDDEYMCYHSVNRGELEIIAFMFKSSAHGI